MDRRGFAGFVALGRPWPMVGGVSCGRDIKKTVRNKGCVLSAVNQKRVQDSVRPAKDVVHLPVNRRFERSHKLLACWRSHSALALHAQAEKNIPFSSLTVSSIAFPGFAPSTKARSLWLRYPS